MSAPQFILPLDDELIVDEFACGGGMSEAIEQATGRHVDISVNHNDDACSMHAANHPQTEHHCQDVFDVCPIKVTRGRPVGLLHMSPDCTDHSQAKGGQPRSKKLRGLAWIGIRWAGQKRPRVITLENVKQIRQWGPLVAKRCKTTGRVVKLDRSVAAPGERVPVEQQFLVPDPKRIGQTWKKFISLLRANGYEVEDRILCAADFGAPTTRRRLIMVARCDGAPIIWPEPTHFKVPKRGQKRWEAVSKHIDWSLPGKSIFDRPKPLADATMHRIALGLKKHVLDSGDPFIVPIANWSRDTIDSIREPLRTITAWPKGGALAVVQPTLVAAFIDQANSGFNSTPARDPREPLSTVTNTGSQQRPVLAHLLHLRGNCDARDLREPIHTISAGGQHHAVVEYTLSPEAEEGALRCAAFLIRYYGEGGQWGDLREPMATATTKDRLAVVTVWIKGDPYVVVDICLRMLTPRELYNASSFPPSYIIDRGHDGRVFSKATQVSMCGNAVPPKLGRAVIAANYQPPYRFARAA
ncbi:modification methylase [Massilia sp. Root418]|uniref:DNA cytosine methyltransferase n=1 Tax=Massilia sp. Root418 TaxID=1736532 RepID=UPI0006F619D6|nr:DNA cytosine methyltransferase [Massilia sp. Root418]KQW97109.1 modification methylase [Massilia sp. Root418]